MKVKELIEALKLVDQEADAIVEYDGMDKSIYGVLVTTSDERFVHEGAKVRIYIDYRDRY